MRYKAGMALKKLQVFLDKDHALSKKSSKERSTL